jgi:hypothetical protein
MAAGVGTPYCPERFRQSAQLADPTSLYGENGGVLAAEAFRPVRLELTPCANTRETPSRAHRGNRYQPCAQDQQFGEHTWPAC